MSALPLPSLLSQVLVARTRELEALGPPVVLPMWANLVRVAEGDAKQLHTAARVSKRAMKSMLTVGTRHEWVTIDDGVVRRTDAGARFDAAWRAVVDADHDDAMRSPLVAIVESLELEHPHYPVGYGTADPRISGGVPHGQDWRPVPRGEGDTTSGLSLVELLAQALVGFTWEYEQRMRIGSLSQAANVLRLVPDEGLPLAALDPAAGVAGNGKSNLERHGFLNVTTGKVVRLSGIGVQVRNAYLPVITKIEEEWIDRFGADVISALRDALGEPDPSLPHHPEVRCGPEGFSERSARSA